MSRPSTIGIVLLAGSVTIWTPAWADQHAAVISVAGCATLIGPGSRYALVNQTFGVLPASVLDGGDGTVPRAA